MVPPKRVPTNISGLWLLTALKLTAVSGMEVRRPKIKNERAKEESLNLTAILWTDFIIRPAPNQMAMKARM